MNPATLLAVVNAAITITEELLPQITAAVKRGEITPEQQAAVLARYESLKAKAAGQFSGPEWQIAS